jgi:hypothetical protein
MDLDRFLKQVEAINPAAYSTLAEKAAGRHVCSHGGNGCEHEPSSEKTGRGLGP